MKRILLALLVTFLVGCGTLDSPKWSAEDGTPIMIPQITTNANNVISTNLVPLVINEVK